MGQHSIIKVNDVAMYRQKVSSNGLIKFITCFGCLVRDDYEVHFNDEAIPKQYRFTPGGRTIPDEYRVVFVLDGHFSFVTEAVTTNVRKGDVIVVRPADWHNFEISSRKLTFAWVGLKNIDLDTLSKYPIFRKTKVYPSLFTIEMKVLVSDMLRMVEKNEQNFEVVVYEGIAYLISLFNHKVSHSPIEVTQLEEKLAAAQEIIHKDRKCIYTVEQVANQIEMDYVLFRRKFKEYSGSSPAQYQTLIRLQNACESLVYSDLSVAEIAIDLGFTDTAQFSTFFHKHMNVTARDYRKNERSRSAKEKELEEYNWRKR